MLRSSVGWIKNKKNNYNFRSHNTFSEKPKVFSGFYLSKKGIYVILLILAVGLFFWFIFGSSFFKVKNIIITGSLNPEVQSEIESFKGKNILTFVLGNTEEKMLKKQSSIKKINVLRGLPDTLKIDVVVRTPQLFWKSGDKNYLLDENGIAFELNQDSDQLKNLKLPQIVDTKNMIVELGGLTVSRDFVKFIIELYRDSNEKAGINLGETRISETTFVIESDTDKNFKLMLDTNRSADVQLKTLKKIIDKYGKDIKEYVDLRFEGRVYFK